MNIPEIYLVEPYNAYAPKQNKKHWHQVIEEQALMAKLVAEQMALQEAASKTLPPSAPEVSTPVVGTAAGAGGAYPPQVFSPTSAVVTFSFIPATGAGPVTVQFINQTSNPELYTYRWFFSDGQTSTVVNPTVVFQSGSNATNVITASLQATSSVFGTPAAISGLTYFSASKPTVTAGFTLVTSSVSASAIVTFTNTTVNTSQTPTTTYLWTFGSGSLTSTSASPGAVSYTVAGPYTASLQATGSYGIASAVTRSFRLV
jgi:PKD repeat protein